MQVYVLFVGLERAWLGQLIAAIFVLVDSCWDGSACSILRLAVPGLAVWFLRLVLSLVRPGWVFAAAFVSPDGRATGESSAC